LSVSIPQVQVAVDYQKAGMLARPIACDGDAGNAASMRDLQIIDGNRRMTCRVAEADLTGGCRN
jgi:hypothetical protein